MKDGVQILLKGVKTDTKAKKLATSLVAQLAVTGQSLQDLSIILFNFHQQTKLSYRELAKRVGKIAPKPYSYSMIYKLCVMGRNLSQRPELAAVKDIEKHRVIAKQLDRSERVAVPVSRYQDSDSLKAWVSHTRRAILPLLQPKQQAALSDLLSDVETSIKRKVKLVG